MEISLLSQGNWLSDEWEQRSLQSAAALLIAWKQRNQAGNQKQVREQGKNTWVWVVEKRMHLFTFQQPRSPYSFP
jgi:hypothetical protein